MMSARNVTFDVLVQHIVDNWVDVLVHVFEQDREAILDSQLQLLQEVVVVERHHLSQVREYNAG